MLCRTYIDSGWMFAIPNSHLDVYVYGREGAVRSGRKERYRDRDTK